MNPNAECLNLPLLKVDWTKLSSTHMICMVLIFLSQICYSLFDFATTLLMSGNLLNNG